MVYFMKKCNLETYKQYKANTQRVKKQQHQQQQQLSFAQKIRFAHAHPFLVYKIVSQEEMEELYNAATVEEIKGLLENNCKRRFNYEVNDDLQNTHNLKIRVEMLLNCFVWIQQPKTELLTAMQASVILSLVDEILTISSQFEHKLNNPLSSNRDTFHHFEARLIAHCIQRPPWSIAAISMRQFSEIIEWANAELFPFLPFYQQSLCDIATSIDASGRRSPEITNLEQLLEITQTSDRIPRHLQNAIETLRVHLKTEVISEQQRTVLTHHLSQKLTAILNAPSATT